MTIGAISYVSIIVAIVLTCPSITAGQRNFGTYRGTVETVWLEDGRYKLLKDFAYIDPSGKKWLAPKDSVVDRASIPKPFWSVIGGPLDGPYKEASVIHDVACQNKSERWEEVHRMFYNAMLASRVDERTAKLMFFGVYYGGPRWGPNASDSREAIRGARYKRLTPAEINAWLRYANPAVQQIEQAASYDQASLKISGEWQLQWQDGQSGIVYQGNLKMVRSQGTMVRRRDVPGGRELTERVTITLFPNAFILMLPDTAPAPHSREIFVAQERAGQVEFRGVMNAGFEGKLLRVTQIR